MAAALTAWPARGAGEILVLHDGTRLVGRIRVETAGQFAIETGDAAGRREVSIPREDVRDVLRGMEELNAIQECRQVGSLISWAGAYFHVGMEIAAKMCVNRAIALDAKLVVGPLTADAPPVTGRARPSDGFRAFWNSIGFRNRLDAMDASNPMSVLTVADWAHRAGQAEYAAFYLRKAVSLQRDFPEARALAEKWAIGLDHWAVPDLTPIFDQPLMASSISDEGQHVPALEGKQFITLPLRYDPALVSQRGEPCILSKTTVRATKRRATYGVRPIPVVDGLVQLHGQETAPVFERADFATDDVSKRLVVLRNLLSPRAEPRVALGPNRQNRPPVQNRLSARAINARAEGRIALIVEINADDLDLHLQWADGHEDVIDLVFLRTIRAAPVARRVDDALRRVSTASSRDDSDSGASTLLVNSPVISDSLAQLSGPSGAMAAVTVEWLSRLRDELMRRDSSADVLKAAWKTSVDVPVMIAAGREEDPVRVAAWRYFCTQSVLDVPRPVPPETLRALAEADEAIQADWLRLIDCAVGGGRCSFWWDDRIGARDPQSVEQHLGSAVRVIRIQRVASVIQTLLQSDDAVICAGAMRLLEALGPGATDWSFLESASLAAQRLALGQVVETRNTTTATGILMALILGAREEIASDIAAAAQTLDLDFERPGELLLSQWWALRESSKKVAFLRVLEGIDLRDAVFSTRFVELVRDAADGNNDMRYAALQFLVAQLRRSRDRSLDPVRRVDTNHQATASVRRYGAFPMLVSPSSDNPLITGASRAVNMGDAELRLEALIALIEQGFGACAAEAFLAARFTDAEQVRLIGRLLEHGAVAGTDALAAFLGAVASSGSAATASACLDGLTQFAATVPPAEAWRLRAALKTGANLGRLGERSTDLSGPAAGAAHRWLYALGHMTAQDRQRMSAAQGEKQRSERLEQTNLRRGRLADGAYGVLAVLTISRPVIRQDHRESTGFAAPPPAGPRWGLPKRITVQLAPVTLQTTDAGDRITAYCDGSLIGEGRLVDRPMPIRPPRAYFPVLSDDPHWWLRAGYESTRDFRRPNSETDEVETGPLLLPDLPPQESPGTGKISLALTDYLRRELSRCEELAGVNVDSLVPKDYRITVRYGLFGCYSGCGTRRYPDIDLRRLTPAELENPPQHLINMMLVLERMEE